MEGNPEIIFALIITDPFADWVPSSNLHVEGDLDQAQQDKQQEARQEKWEKVGKRKTIGELVFLPTFLQRSQVPRIKAVCGKKQHVAN